MDIDLLGYTDNDLANLEAIGRALCSTPEPEPDGLTFDADTVKAIRIKEDADYEGVRVTFTARLDNVRIPMQIDVGFNDIVTPAPEPVAYPSLLGMHEPQLRGYNRDTLIAEKLEAMIKLGEINSRMKDFFDIWALSRSFPFELQSLAAAIDATCRRRGCRRPPGHPEPRLPGRSRQADAVVGIPAEEPNRTDTDRLRGDRLRHCHLLRRTCRRRHRHKAPSRHNVGAAGPLALNRSLYPVPCACPP